MDKIEIEQLRPISHQYNKTNNLAIIINKFKLRNRKMVDTIEEEMRRMRAEMDGEMSESPSIKSRA